MRRSSEPVGSNGGFVPNCCTYDVTTIALHEYASRSGSVPDGFGATLRLNTRSGHTTSMALATGCCTPVSPGVVGSGVLAAGAGPAWLARHSAPASVNVETRSGKCGEEMLFKAFPFETSIDE